MSGQLAGLSSTGRAIRLAVGATVLLLFAGAAYLYAVRGTALLMDLGAGLRSILCL